jgi:hypothetical protein
MAWSTTSKRIVLTLLAAWLWAAPTEAAITVVQSQTNRCSGASTCSVTVSGLTAGNLLVVSGGLLHATRTLTPSTDGTNVCSGASPDVQNEHSNGSVDVRAYIWSCQITAGGQTTVTVTINTGTSFLNITAMEVSGMATSSALDVTASGSTDPSGTVHDVSVAPTTTFADDLIVVQMCANATSTYTAGVTYTLIAGGSGGVECGTQYKIVSATGTYTANGVTTSNRFVTTGMAAYKMASAAAGGTKKLTVLGIGEPR